MSTLFSIFPFLIFHPAIAAPTGLQGGLADQVLEGLRSFVQEFIDFLNPHYSPSLKQTVISCLAFLIISIFLIRPPVRARAKHLRLTYVTAALYGLLSPDFMGFKVWGDVLGCFFFAVVYNSKFRGEARKKRWTGEHIAFLRHGGFVLQEGDKPAQVLSFDHLVRMIKADEIERPDISTADILARSIRAPLFRRIISWLSCIPICWFVKKFTFKLPLVVAFVALHALLTWTILALRSTSITGVKEPFAIVRKSREEIHGLSASEGDVDKSEGVSSRDLVDLGKDVKVVEEKRPIPTDDRRINNAQSNAPPDETRHGRVVRLLVLPFELFFLIFCILCEFLGAVISSSTVSLRYQWAIISGPCHLDTIGDYVVIMLGDFLVWIGFAAISWRVPFDIERKVWVAASLFLLLQPLALLLVRPQRIRMRVGESIRRVIYVLYSFAYIVARLSIFLAALYSIKKAM